MPIGAILGVGSALIGAGSAASAASAQKSAAKKDMAFQKETRDLIRTDLKPYVGSGGNALSAYNYELGLGPAPTLPGGATYGGYTKAPGYDFRMQGGQDALQASAAARGGLLSGAALQASQQFGQDYATSEYDKYLAKLQGQQSVGLSASSMNANAATNAAAGVSNALSNYGNAASAGAIGVGNAFNTGIGNVLGAFNYQRNLTPAASPAHSMGGGGGNFAGTGGGGGNWFSGMFQ